jgi:hypothetical protein
MKKEEKERRKRRRKVRTEEKEKEGRAKDRLTRDKKAGNDSGTTDQATEQLEDAIHG